MIVLFQWLWGRFAAAVGLILPMIGRAADTARKPAVYWVFHVILIAAILVGLGWLNHYFDLPRYVHSPLSILARVWLPLLFLLVYVDLWLARGLWLLLQPSARPSPHPDIDAAWADALQAIDRAGLDLGRVPVFLVLGEPVGGADALFAASGLALNPMGNGEVVRVFAGPGAVFVTAPDACLTGGLAKWAATLAGPRPSVQAEAVPATDAVPSLTAVPESTDGSVAVPVPPLTKNPPEMDRLAGRFAYLLERVRRTRRPFTPVNGVLVLVPETCTRSETVAGPAAAVIARDVAAVTDVAEVRCPVLPVVCDGEQLPGVVELLELLPAERRGQRLGRKLPYAPRLSPKDRGDLLANAVRWVCGDLVPRLTYRVMPADERASALVRLTAELHNRREVMAGQFARAFGSDEVGTVWVGGWYMAATGPTAERRGFLADVFSQLLEGQNFVAWTATGRERERVLNRWTWAGYAAALALTAGMTAWVVVAWPFG